MKEGVGGIGALGHGRRMDLGSSVWYVGNLFGFLADSGETDGQFALIEILGRKGGEPPRHVHSREDEGFYVMEGEVTFYVGDETHAATPGTFVFAPRGVPHSFVFETEEIRMISIITPGGFDEHFRDPRFSEPAQALTLPPPLEGPPDVGALVANLESYGIEVVGPPGPPQQAASV